MDYKKALNSYISNDPKAVENYRKNAKNNKNNKKNTEQSLKKEEKSK